MALCKENRLTDTIVIRIASPLFRYALAGLTTETVALRLCGAVLFIETVGTVTGERRMNLVRFSAKFSLWKLSLYQNSF